MRAKLVAVGNSRGIRLPKPLLEESGLGEEVEIEVRGGQIVLRAVHAPREGWEDAFREMTARGDDAPLAWEGAEITAFDQEEWEW